MQLAHLADLRAYLWEVEEEIQDGFSQFQDPIELLDSIPGIDQTAVYTILAEIREEMTAFPIALHICSWARLAPGNYESTNKQKRQRITRGNIFLKTKFCEVAWEIAAH
ncbi:MAG: hypothetical protein C3F13_04710 [Anaerolineales bacterium]|nr:IS110 family transposase [Anaerolineae bacterium]PWB55218.1 MAG: hypothetical protein C3F13_04710 [Anaerolineales bacterium]